MSVVASGFTLDVRPDRERVHVVPAGELDMATCPLVEAEVDGLLERRFRHVVIDLRQLTFIDSSGAHLLLNAGRRAQASGSRLSLMLAPGAVSRVLELCGVLECFEVVR